MPHAPSPTPRAPRPDALLSWRSEFPILETCNYLVSHSLGAMPTRARRYLERFADEWDRRGVQAWHEGWWEIGRETGNVLAPTLGAAPDTITMHQNATVAQSIVASCFSYAGSRRRIVLQDLDFPTNHYLFEGFRRFGAEVVVVPSENAIQAPIDRLVDAIDDRTVLVPLSLVLFRSGALQDVRPVIEKAHRVGAYVVLDAYQGAGTIPMHVADLGVDFVVGGSVKWLCGGPGAGYLYVRPDLISTMRPSVVGWAGHTAPFGFETGAIRYAETIERFQSGTPNVPALYSARAGYEIVAEIGVPAIRERSLRLTRRLIDAADRQGWRLNTPTSDADRGGSVVLDVPDGAAVTDELIRRKVVVDYRPGAGIRVAPHFYNTEAEVDAAAATIEEILKGIGPMTVKTIAVLGAGTMGHGIAHAAAAAGYDTRLYDVSDAQLAQARGSVESILRKTVELGKGTAADADRTLGRLTTTNDLTTALGGVDVVIEAAPERVEIKLSLMSEIDRLAPAEAVIATNTSALSITEIAGVLVRPSRVAGMHFFNPVHKMKLIEIVRALESSPETLETIESVARRMGKETVLVREAPGFITTRVNASIGNEAFYMLMEGVASARDIDKALKLGLNHPMGPFELVDLVGLDTRLSILEYLHRSMGEKYRPCPLLAQYVKAGRLGKKVGKGIYEY